MSHWGSGAESELRAEVKALMEQNAEYEYHDTHAGQNEAAEEEIVKTRWSAKRAAAAWRTAEHKAFMDSPVGVSDQDCERLAQEHLVKARLDALRDAALAFRHGKSVQTLLEEEVFRLSKKRRAR